MLPVGRKSSMIINYTAPFLQNIKHINHGRLILVTVENMLLIIWRLLHFCHIDVWK